MGFKANANQSHTATASPVETRATNHPRRPRRPRPPPAPVDATAAAIRQPRKDCRPLALPKPKDGQCCGAMPPASLSPRWTTGAKSWWLNSPRPLTTPTRATFSLMAQTERNLGRKPKSGAWDAAYDTFYVHEYFTLAGGFACSAVGHAHRPEEDFLARRPAALWPGLAMPLKSVVQKKSNCLVPHELGRYACPLLFPATAGAVPIDHPNWQREGRSGAVSPLCPPASAHAHATNSTAPVKRTSAS
ncbi:MAG: hypothetical protein R3E79_04675 [Caldilineaceae bacterium]